MFCANAAVNYVKHDYQKKCKSDMSANMQICSLFSYSVHSICYFSSILVVENVQILYGVSVLTSKFVNIIFLKITVFHINKGSLQESPNEVKAEQPLLYVYLLLPSFLQPPVFIYAFLFRLRM